MLASFVLLHVLCIALCDLRVDGLSDEMSDSVTRHGDVRGTLAVISNENIDGPVDKPVQSLAASEG
jgi:hypothetical protein